MGIGLLVRRVSGSKESEMEHVTKPCFLILFSSNIHFFEYLATRDKQRPVQVLLILVLENTYRDIHYYFLLIHNPLLRDLHSKHT